MRTGWKEKGSSWENVAEITIDLALHARANMAEGRANGAEDSIVTEMMNSFHRTNSRDCNVLQRLLCGLEEAPSSWNIVKWECLRKPDAGPQKGIRSYRATRWRRWCRSGTRLVLFYDGKRRSDLRSGSRCVLEESMVSVVKIIKVILTQLLRKRWKWQEDRRNNFWQGSEKRPTMYFASMDRQTAFDVARPKQIAKSHGERRGPVDELQLLHEVKWRNLKGTRLPRMLKASSISCDASAKAASKPQRCGSYCRSRFCGTRRKSGRGGGWNPQWETLRWKPSDMQYSLVLQLLGAVSFKNVLGTDNKGADWSSG